MVSLFFMKGDPMKKILPFVIVLVLIPLTSGNWNMFMHDEEHTGFNDIDMKNINSVIWSFDLEGRVCSSPVIVEDVIYIGSEKYFYAIDLNGNILWKKEMNILWSSPTILDNIYIGTWDGYVYCLNKDGEIIWDIELGKEIRGSPLVYKDRIFIGTGGLNPSFYCIDALTGEIQWSYKTISPIKTSASAWNDRIYIVFQNDIYADELYCFDLDGNLVWKYKTSDVPEGICVPPIATRRTQFITSSPTIYKDRVYFGSGEKKAYCIDCKTGELIWEFKTKETKWMKEYATGEDRIISTLAAAYDMVYFGSWNNTIYALDADTGSEIWTFLTGDKTISSPAVADGMVYLGCMDGHFYCFDSDGNILGDFKLGKVLGSPSISNGYVFVPAGSKLYCLGEKAQEIKETKTEENGNPSSKTYYIIGAVIGIVILIAIGMKRR
ncbi:hypothetical protein DRN45_05375 [Thermococci archaeon]|nr:MAG: hypothetical protein DRN45_05375 [Thermococci archaeon]